MCFRFKNKNVLIEIRFPKNFWCRMGANEFVSDLHLDAMRLDDDVFSQYYKYLYYDLRLYKNIRYTADPRRHIVFVFGDQK